MKRQDTGILGENLARDFLKEKGYQILETNYRCPEGEIDIVAKHREQLVFIEVRTKSSSRFGSPEESITPAKMKRLRATAARFQQNHTDLPQLWRIDVVAIELNRMAKPTRIELIESAVGEDFN